ncbi:aldehyde dehydrogenase [Paenibacillus sp. 32352]|uniref:aldehyde dehydrogenase n=1 Tax=Paenibacillus sp. 32352 TaxID=1969111 RepID=UPI00117EE86A|nr:aldehyde dehydrogenase [Paenibacillus sp. 32352]
METIVKGMDCLHFIDGRYVHSQEPKTFDNINPATEEVLGQVAEGGQAEVELAVEAAKRAFDGGWKHSKLSERAAILRRIGDLILQRKDELAMLETLDTGKPLWLSTNVDIPRAAGSYHFYANFISTMGTEAYPSEAGAMNFVVRRPLGVVGMINPWNLPLLLLSAKLAPCLAMGNTVVLKPARWTPMTATLLGEICKEAGLPDGVVNIVNGAGRSVGEAISEHPDVRAIAFTGETTTGKSIMKAGSASLKRLSFELGGKNPNIIFADCDLDEVVDTSLRSSFINQGAVCLCGSRIYVQRPIYEAFLEKFIERTRQQTVGDPLQPNTNIGALISKQHYDRVLDYIQSAREDGCVIETGGNRADGLDRGFYVEPTIITGVDAGCRVVNEEIFGPVVTVQPFDTEEEVIALANDTHYGLSASIWTKDSSRAFRVAHQIEAGLTWVNTWFLRDPRTPYGGEKQSGIGRQGGMFSLDFYSEVSTICIKY